MNEIISDLYYKYAASDEYLRDKTKLENGKIDSLYTVINDISNGLYNNKVLDIEDVIISHICRHQKMEFILGFKYAMRLMFECDIEMNIEKITDTDYKEDTRELNAKIC